MFSQLSEIIKNIGVYGRHTGTRKKTTINVVGVIERVKALLIKRAAAIELHHGNLIIHLYMFALRLDKSR